MSQPSYYILPPTQAPPPPPLPPKSNLPMLYYGLVVVGTAAVVLALYNLIIIKWCTSRYRSGRRVERFVELEAASRSFENPNRNLLSSFKYKKDAAAAAAAQEPGSGYECAVCLSIFEDGEEVRQLPRCKHSFHMSCIDMWLYSHSDCPLCRSPVHPPSLQPRLQPPPPLPPESAAENSREGLLESGVSV